MSDQLAEVISEEVADFLSRLEPDGTIQYNGRWLTAEEAVDRWSRNEGGKLEQALWEALNDAYNEWSDEQPEPDDDDDDDDDTE